MRDPLFYCFLQSFLFFFSLYNFFFEICGMQANEIFSRGKTNSINNSVCLLSRNLKFEIGGRREKGKNSRNIIIFFLNELHTDGGEINKGKGKQKKRKEKRYLPFSITHHIFRQKWEIKFVNKTVLFTINTKFPFINMPQTRLRQIKLYLY